MGTGGSSVEKPAKIQTLSTGWLALWLVHITPGQEGMS